MRKILLIAALTGVALLLVPLTPTHAGELGSVINITKVVEGDGPTGPYSFEAACSVNQAPPQTIAFSLDAGETFPLVLLSTAQSLSCTLAELDDQGADSVTFDCTEDSGGASCDSDATVSWPAQLPGEATIVVTNTFDPDPTTTTTAPSTTTTAATAAPVAAAVVATPAFTG